MGSRQSQHVESEYISDLSRETGFKPNIIRKLFERFKQLDKGNNDYLTRADFLRIPELTINPIGDRIVHSFFRESNSETVSFRHFLRVLARFRDMNGNSSSLSSKEEKLRFIFRLYDLDDDNSISSEELLDILVSMTSGSIDDTEVRGIVQQSISEADTNGDNQIGFQEFYKVMEDEHIAEKLCIQFWKGN